MSRFELRVEFAGLCLYVVDPGGTKVAVVMPDARRTVDGLHADDEIGESHAGYVRFDLANLDVGRNSRLSVAGGTMLDEGAGSPPCEVVHRFDGQRLDFRLPDGSPLPEQPFETMKLGVPDFSTFATSVGPIPGALNFGSAPPREVLMQTRITGGALKATGRGKTWAFSSALAASTNGNGGPRPYSGQFAGFAVWTRDIDASGITLTISNFDGSGEQTIPLVPTVIKGRRVIALKVANLCANNPLEWDEYPLRTVVSHDLDFKWLYRLLKPATGEYKAVLAGAELPFPRALANQAFGDEDCMGGSITASFT
jgi:hypothetical protein